MDSEARLVRIERELNAVCVSVTSGFSEIKKDVSYLGRFYIPLALVAILALVASMSALFVATSNRELILSINHSDQQQQVILAELERKVLPENSGNTP